VRVLAYVYTDTLTDANRFYNLSNAICYSDGTDNHRVERYQVDGHDSDDIEQVGPLSQAIRAAKI